jgi:hypothetical protein
MPASGRLSSSPASASMAPGITSVAAFGHTPGHSLFTVKSGGQSFIYVADLTNVPELFARNPDWAVTFDMDPEMARQTRRKIFELKNQLFLTIANDRALRRKLEFKYLVSKNFRVVKYCESCQKTNAEQALERHKWKYCKQCDVDHNFYNLLSMETRFPQGFARMFISNDQIAKLEYFKLPRRVNVDTLKEEAIIDQFHYNTRNLDAIELESVMSVHTKLLTPPTSSLSKSKLSEIKSTKSK